MHIVKQSMKWENVSDNDSFSSDEEDNIVDENEF